MAASPAPRPRVLLIALVLSLALNGIQAWRAPAPAAKPAATLPRPAAETEPKPRPHPGRAGLPADLARSLAAGEPAALRDLLEGAGMDPKLRKQLLQTMLMHRYEARFRALYGGDAPTASAQWWRDPDPAHLRASASGAERIAAGRKLQEEFQAEVARLTGEDPTALDLENNPWLARRFAGLPRDKAEALHRLQRDYEEIEQQIRMEAGAFELPSDREKLRLLHVERERDLAELLTPEERSAWELRASPSADRTRHLATRYQASEEEYHRLYALQRAYDAEFETPDHELGTEQEMDWKKREAAREALERAIRAIVGDERYLAARRENDQDFILARSAAERLGLPAETAIDIHALRGPVATESRRIAEDAGLGPAEKRAALAKLAAETRGKVEEALGREAAETFFQRGGMHWLDAVGRGARAEATEHGVETYALDGVTEAGQAAPWSRPALFETSSLPD